MSSCFGRALVQKAVRMTTRHSAALAASTVGLRKAPVFQTQLWHVILADTSQRLWSQLCICLRSFHSTESCAMFGEYTTPMEVSTASKGEGKDRCATVASPL